MSTEQVDRVIAQLPPDLRVLASLVFDAHLRLGEALALQRTDVKLAERLVVVHRGVTEVDGEQVETGTKTGHRRDIDLDSAMVHMLAEFFDTHPRSPQARVFQRADGSQLRHHHVQGAWKRARERAGLTEYRFHDLRHAGLTALAEEGLPGSSLMYRAGHSTTAAMLNYQHRAARQGRVEASKFAEKKARDREAARMREQTP